MEVHGDLEEFRFTKRFEVGERRFAAPGLEEILAREHANLGELLESVHELTDLKKAVLRHRISFRFWFEKGRSRIRARQDNIVQISQYVNRVDRYFNKI